MRDFRLIPAMELCGGCVVRLRNSDPAQATVYSSDPAAVALQFAEAGAPWLHVVDLDAALHGTQPNSGVINRILGDRTISVELGGGIRSREAIAHWIEAGVARVVVGTMAVRTPEMVRWAVETFGSLRIVVALDCHGDEVLATGWREPCGVPFDELFTRLLDLGVTEFAVSDVDRDVRLLGPHVERYAELLRRYHVQLYAGGGIGTIAHLEELAHLPELAGAILGRALYEKRCSYVDAQMATTAARMTIAAPDDVPSASPPHTPEH